MGISGKYLLLFLTAILSCHFIDSKLIHVKNEKSALTQNLIPGNVKGRRLVKLPFPGGIESSSRIGNFRSKNVLNAQNMQTFNRPEGTESLITNVNNNLGSETSYGRTFGQYGSYKNHKSWQHAVAEDRQRYLQLSEDLKVTFPWIMHQLHTPSIHGFGLNGFWNSYAVPEGTSNVKDPGALVRSDLIIYVLTYSKL